ncbi:MerR family transcriptional regulator [Clostridium felsineum]|uniref:MerR family transcriptional regulator n=1 Tax=Clostridium felsineum TaxID=36839 RepID=UPI00098C2767|nr:MerR family transcriptional regulator [Clostridium felsineum]URZ14603.1 putative HTH-type transcriptional regulator [Clostridium felsineum DSM 794]
MYYTIGEISKIINVSVHTLRFYAKEGLMPFVERNKSGIRMFKDEDFEPLFMIEYLKKSGMSIKEIREFMNWCMQGDETIGKRLNMFREQQKKVEDQIKELQTTLDLIKLKCWYYETAKVAGTCSVHKALKPVDIPKDIIEFKESMEKIYFNKQL